MLGNAGISALPVKAEQAFGLHLPAADGCCRDGRRTFVIRLLLAAAFVCTLCAACAPAAFADECPAGGSHDFAAQIVTYPSDGQPGLRQYTCLKCGYSYTEQIPASGHSWTAWTVESEPTCTQQGLTYRTCTVCGDVEEEYEPALGHDYVLSAHTDATCTDAGTDTYTCSRCGDSYTQEGQAALGHDFQQTSHTDATCTDEGVTVLTCSRCGVTETQTQAALGHNWGEWIVDSEATDTQPGHRHRVCANDSFHVEEEDIPATGVVAGGSDGGSDGDAGDAQNGQSTGNPFTDLMFSKLYPGSDLNVMDATLSTATIVCLVVAVLLVYPLLMPVLWARRKHATLMAEKAQQRTEAADRRRREAGRI